MANGEHTCLNFPVFAVKPEACRPKNVVVSQRGLLEGSLRDGQWQLFIFSLIDLNSPLYNVE